jgi:hypothetical protein
MTADDIPKDAPLLRCWLKKSWSTSKKVGLWLGGIAVVLIAAYVAWLGLTSQTAAKIWAALTGWCGSIISGILNYIATIPPLVFWGSVIVSAIVLGVLGYSLIWCVVRNLQDCDWASDTATTIAAISIAAAIAATIAAATIAAIAAIAIAAISIAIAIAIAATIAAISIATIAIAAISIAAIAIAATIAAAIDDRSSMWYYAFRFLGAYLNYRKRMKATSTISVVEEI